MISPWCRVRIEELLLNVLREIREEEKRKRGKEEKNGWKEKEKEKEK